jgi:hypothetical protein
MQKEKEILESVCGQGISESDCARTLGVSLRHVYDVLNRHIVLKGDPLGFVRRVPDGE